MKHLLLATLLLLPTTALAESVSELVASGLVLVHIEPNPEGNWSWMFLGPDPDTPTYVCFIDRPLDPEPNDTCRPLA